MNVVGRVESLWRYPVKSMAGEALRQASIGFAGVYGDRLYAFRSAGASAAFPFLTGRERAEMLLYRPVFRHPELAMLPANLTEAKAAAPGLNPLPADPTDMIVDVRTPSGQTVAIDDPALVGMLQDGLGARHRLTLLRSERAMTDSRPVSLFSIQTARQIGEELGEATDQRRYRANIYIDLAAGSGFAEDAFVGRSLGIGDTLIVTVTDRDSRCKMITLDPDTAQANPKVLRHVARAHEGKAGVYAAVLVEGVVLPGDEVRLL